MIKVYYEEYRDDSWNKLHVKEFETLDGVADWIFDQMRTDYVKDFRVMCIPTPKKAERTGDEAPWTIEFTPELSGPTFWIRQMKENGRIIFTDGTMTAGQKHWSKAVKDWCTSIEERRKAPTFDFAD